MGDGVGAQAPAEKTRLRPHSAPAYGHRPPSHEPTPLDWAEGWDGHPLKQAAPRWTIPSAGRCRDDDTGRGFRLTYMDKVKRTYSHVPGPGAYKVYQDFAHPRTKSEFGKRQTPGRARSAGCLRTAPTREEGDEVAANRVILSRPSSAQISSTKRIANLTSYSKAPKSKLPSSFDTPGPGAYTQYSTFGMASGACSKRYLAASQTDNFSACRAPQKFTRYTQR